ncbi:MAG: hypothetical protein GOU97_02190 [Nanoarchaeota archaeon]|nr:hypothetical protein [Nanoarchaeota archaeon]
MKECPKGKKGFSMTLLLIGVLWLLSDLKVIALNLPWWPILLIVVAMGLLMKPHYHKK